MASSTSAEYPWSSTVNVGNFVTVRPWFNEDNMERSIRDYKIWKEQMVCLLESQDLLGFIDGETPPPPPDSDHGESMGKLWRRTDMLIKGWILGSIGDNALDAVVRLNSSREVWLELENLFNIQMKADTDEVGNQTSDGNDGIDNNEVQNQASDGSDENGPVNDEDDDGMDNNEVQNQASDGSVDENGAVKDEDGIVEHSSEPPSNGLDQGNVGSGRDINSYLPLYKAALRGDWEEGKKFLDENKEGTTAILNGSSETLLHIAVMTGISNDFVRNLLERISEDALASKNIDGETALHLAAVVGNTEAVKMLVKRNRQLQYILNKEKYLPVHLAAIFCHKETVTYLISMSEEEVESSPFVGELGATLLIFLISSGFVGLALFLVEIYPNIATIKGPGNKAPLEILAGADYLFLGGESLSWWQNWIYSLTCVKRIKDKKVMHQEALELAKFLCEKTASLPNCEAEPIFKSSIIKAAEHGIHELIEEIVEKFPMAVFTVHAKTKSNIFLLAAGKRLENVFNLIYQMNDHKFFFFDSQDSSCNNFMHISANLAPPHKLNLVSGAALQMQRELQWFKEMEKFVNHSRRTWPNKDGLTPEMLFTKEHNELKAAGEKWMKHTAASCSIAAALIATVVFSAAFTVPGNFNNDTGIPILLHKTPFFIFTITDSVSLFTSTTSLLVFLSILTSRYAEEDFLHVLPKRLCMGLLTLFTSITFMMIAFTAAIYIMLQHKSRLLLIPAALLAFLPVASFVLLQFPLLVAVLCSTYGPGIFGKKSDRTLH